MKSLFDEQLRSAMLARIERVTTGSRPRWGKMNAEQMLAHLTEAMRMAVGEIETKPKKVPIRFPPLKQLAIYLAPWPKGAPTAAELMPSDTRSVETSKSELARLLAAFGSRANRTDWPRHPAFGAMSRRAWGVLAWRHLDHHLRQFGV